MRTLSLLTLSLLVVGCGRLPKPLYPILEAERALDAHRVGLEPLMVFRAEARIDQREGARRIRGTVLMMVERPDRVRIDAMTRLGAAATLTSDGERFALLDLREGRLFTGPSCAENVGRGLGVALEPLELVRFLLGDAPRLEGARVTLTPRRGGYEVELHDARGMRQVIELALPAEQIEAEPEAQRPRMTRATLYDASGARILRVTFSSHAPVRAGDQEVLLPREVRLEAGGAGADIQLRYKSITPLDEAPEGAFEPPAPGGISTEHLPCE